MFRVPLLLLTIAWTLFGCSCRPQSVEEKSAAHISPDELAGQAQAAEETDDGDANFTTPKSLPRDQHEARRPAAEIDAPTRGWLAKLADEDPKARAEAAAYLETLEPRAIDVLQQGMKDPSPEVRTGAAFGLLGRFYGDQPRIIDEFIEALGDTESAVRSIALRAIGQMNPQAAGQAIPRLITLLGRTSEEDHLRAQIVRILSDIGTESPESLAAVENSLRGDPSRNVRAASLRAVVSLSTDPTRLIGVLARTVTEDQDPIVRRLAAAELGKIGPGAAGGIPQLLEALSDPDKRVHTASARALVQIGSASVEPLIELTKSKHRTARVWAALTLGDIGPPANAAVPRLKELAQDPDPAIHEAARLALRKIGAG